MRSQHPFHAHTHVIQEKQREHWLLNSEKKLPFGRFLHQSPERRWSSYLMGAARRSHRLIARASHCMISLNGVCTHWHYIRVVLARSRLAKKKTPTHRYTKSNNSSSLSIDKRTDEWRRERERERERKNGRRRKRKRKIRWLLYLNYLNLFQTTMMSFTAYIRTYISTLYRPLIQ